MSTDKRGITKRVLSPAQRDELIVVLSLECSRLRGRVAFLEAELEGSKTGVVGVGHACVCGESNRYHVLLADGKSLGSCMRASCPCKKYVQA